MINTDTFDDTEVRGKVGVSFDVAMSPLLEEPKDRQLFAETESPTWIEKGPSRQFLVQPFSSTWTEQALDGWHAQMAKQDERELRTLSSIDFTDRRGRPPIEDEEAIEANPLTKAAEARVQLLARKYVAKEKFSEEESARLAIVTERVRKLLPAVTAYEFEALESGLTALRSVAESNAKLEERLRIMRQAHG